jgi:TonB family protein
MLLAAPFVFTVAVTAQLPHYGPEQPPPPQGQRIEAKDGDTIVLRGSARVRVVHRSEGQVRAIYNAEQQWLILLVDYVDPQTGAPDGGVDSSYRFDAVSGAWPLGERWDGSAVIDEYTMFKGGATGVGLTTSAGLIQMLSSMNSNWFQDSRAVATLSYRGSGSSVSRGQSFAEVEQRTVADAIRNAQNRGGTSVTTLTLPNGAAATSSLSVAAGGVVNSPRTEPARPGDYPPPENPVRVGGNVRQPAKLVHVEPVLPPQAAQANVRGVVIVEVTIDTQGAVSGAKVLRSIPLLDRAAIDAVRQWRFEPTELNGRPVPVIMTVTVNFR